MALVEAGVGVAGKTSNGLEITILKSTKTEYEQKSVPKEKCESEYDYFDDQYHYKCHTEYVYEDVPVTKTIYIVSGAIARNEQKFSPGAFAQAAALGAKAFRRT